jgi:F420-non-reducing hydrogenase iron-sulfur subunit
LTEINEVKNTAEFEPKIIAFSCNYCAYAAADLAGTSRMRYPSNIRMIRLMCTGMLDPIYVLEAFKRGADGVLVAGCHPGDCHFLTGNYKARRRIELMKRLLNQLGIGPERLRLEWISAAEAAKFVEVTTSFTNKIKELGPSPLRST